MVTLSSLLSIPCSSAYETAKARLDYATIDLLMALIKFVNLNYFNFKMATGLAFKSKATTSGSSWAS